MADDENRIEVDPMRRGWKANADAHGEVRIDWHAQIYDDKPLSRVHLGLMHVRAADNLIIEFSGSRNGWVIRMDRTRDDGGMMEVVEEAVEVAFVPAWLEDDQPTPENG